MNMLFHLIGTFLLIIIWIIGNVGTSAEMVIAILLANMYWDLPDNQSNKRRKK